MTTGDLSPYEVELKRLLDSYPKFKDNLLETKVGPKIFVESMCELGDLDLFVKYNHLKAGLLNFKNIELKNPINELCILYVRAFQSMHSKAYIKKFIIAIGDGRFTGPIDLSKIESCWCNEEHQLYMKCWNKISKMDELNSKKRREKDILIGKSIIGKIIASMPNLKSSKVAQQIIDKVKAHEATNILLSRITTSVKDDDTAELFNDVFAYYKALYSSGEIDMAKLSREAMKFAQKSGIDTTSAMGQINKILPMLNK